MALSKLTKVQTLGIGSNIEVVGVITTGQFKSGTSNLHSTGVELTNLNVSGIATIGGNVSIGGTLTYEDVTNIDSVGVITARSNIDCNGSLDVDGHTDLDNVSIAGVTTFSSSKSQFDSTGTLYLNSGGSVGSGNYYTKIGSDGSADFLSNISIADKIIHYGDTNTAIRFPAADTFSVETAGSERLRITSAGRMGLGKSSPSQLLHLKETGSNSTYIALEATDANNNVGILMGDPDDIDAGFILYSNQNNYLAFATNGANERLRIASNGNIEMGSGAGTGSDYSLLDGMVINTANGSAGLIINSSSSSHNAYMSFGYGSGSGTSHNDQYSAYIGRVGDNNLIFGTNNSIRASIDSNGHFIPQTNNVYDLGSTTKGWRNVYMNDLNLSNMKGNTNDVDGTQGSWTIQEGENDLFIINRLNGKKFKIKMEEIS